MDFDVIIAGGGLNGSALAIALDQVGFRVALADPLAVEMRSDPSFDGRSYALALASQRLLSVLGLWPDLAPHAQPILEIKVTDGRPGEGPSAFMLGFDHAEIEEGPMGYLVEDRHLRRTLLSWLAQSGVSHLSGVSITGHASDLSGVNVDLEGHPQRARLLVGADGMRSPTAKRAGVKRLGWGYGQRALVCAVAHERPNNGVAHQFFTPSGPLAILPLSGNRCSIVWTERDAQAARIQELDDDAYLQVLRPRFGDFLGDITLAGERFTYPLLLSMTRSFVADRVALVGDAAHRVHPIAGQGLNAGLKDVAALVEVLAHASRRGECIGSSAVLARYQKWRSFDTATLALATDGFNRLFSNDNPILRIGRDLGLGLVQSLPGLRRGFIREAAGLTGDVPRLLQGKPV